MADIIPLIGWSAKPGAGRHNGRTSCNHFATQRNQIRRNQNTRGETGRDMNARKAQ